MRHVPLYVLLIAEQARLPLRCYRQQRRHPSFGLHGRQVGPNLTNSRDSVRLVLEAKFATLRFHSLTCSRPMNLLMSVFGPQNGHEPRAILVLQLINSNHSQDVIGAYRDTRARERDPRDKSRRPNHSVRGLARSAVVSEMPASTLSLKRFPARATSWRRPESGQATKASTVVAGARRRSLKSSSNCEPTWRNSSAATRPSLSHSSLPVSTSRGVCAGRSRESWAAAPAAWTFASV